MISELVQSLGIAVGLITLVLAGILIVLYFVIKQNEERKLTGVKVETRRRKR